MRRQADNKPTTSMSTSRSAISGKTNAVTTRRSDPSSSPIESTGLPIPPVVAVETGRTAARPA